MSNSTKRFDQVRKYGPINSNSFTDLIGKTVRVGTLVINVKSVTQMRYGVWSLNGDMTHNGKPCDRTWAIVYSGKQTQQPTKIESV